MSEDNAIRVVVLNELMDSFPQLPYFAAATTRGKGLGDMVDTTKDDQLKLVKKLLDLGHTSPLEHCTINFYLQNVSRACLDQLNRYRIASICMESQRYVNMSDKPTRIPDSIASCEAAYSLVVDHIAKTNELYCALVDQHKIPKEDARSILEMGRLCNETFTCNLREFMHISRERLCHQAQPEIRELVTKMRQKMISLCPDMVHVLTHSSARPPCTYCTHSPCGEKLK